MKSRRGRGYGGIYGGEKPIPLIIVSRQFDFQFVYLVDLKSEGVSTCVCVGEGKKEEE